MIKPVVLTADRLWDGKSSEALGGRFVRVSDGRIDVVGRTADLPHGTEVRDLGDVTLMPGLINAHVHITLSANRFVLEEYLREKEAGYETLMRRAQENLRHAVSVGVTTVRDLGTMNDVVLAARDAVRDGSQVGPDIVAAGEGITSKGGHCYFFGIECRSVGELRNAVKRQVSAGADLIKVFATGGNLTPDTDPFAPQFETEELVAVVEEARKAGIPIAAHAHAPEGIRRSIAARVDTIEHCTFETPNGIDFDETAAEQMAAFGIAAVPTPGKDTFDFVRDPSLMESIPEPGRSIVKRIISKMPQIAANFRRLRELGVPVIAGTDAGIPDRHFEDFPKDMGFLSDELGVAMGAREALIAATSGCALALGLSDRGSIEIGKRADLLAVGGNPLAQLCDLPDTRFVMVNGRVVVDPSAEQ